MTFTLHRPARLDLCYDSLHGLSVGDALGARFFMVGRSLADLDRPGTAGVPADWIRAREPLPAWALREPGS